MAKLDFLFPFFDGQTVIESYVLTYEKWPDIRLRSDYVGCDGKCSCNSSLNLTEQNMTSKTERANQEDSSLITIPKVPFCF